jgi:hypothetical protein
MWHKWGDDIKMVFKAAGWRGADYIQIAQNRDVQQAFVKMVMNFQVP